MAFPIGIRNAHEMQSYMLLRPSLYGNQDRYCGEPTPKPIKRTIENEDFFVLLERARAGDSEAREELRLRGNKTER